MVLSHVIFLYHGISHIISKMMFLLWHKVIKFWLEFGSCYHFIRWILRWFHFRFFSLYLIYLYNILGFVRLRWCSVILSIHSSRHPSHHPSFHPRLKIKKDKSLKKKIKTWTKFKKTGDFIVFEGHRYPLETK